MATAPTWNATNKMKDVVENKLVKEHGIDPVAVARKYEPWLFGLFTPHPRYPPQKLTLDSLLMHGLPRVVLLTVLTVCTGVGISMFLYWMGVWWLVTLLSTPLGYAGYLKAKRSTLATSEKRKTVADKDLKWFEHCKEVFSPDSIAAQLSRQKLVEEALAKVKPQKGDNFNSHIRGATSLAVYGCGILAAGHVGGLRALEKHGLNYNQLGTLAGVSAGSVVVACVAVGYSAEELFNLILEMPFHRLAIPELGSLLRIVGTVLEDVAKKLCGQDIAAIFEPLARGSGPGFNSGKALYDMAGDALERKTNDRDITFKQVLDRYKKRVVILVCELDSGKEVHLTPETHPDLPLRAAVRMSMGVPGLMEPFEYNGHYYCDGGMCNDFPMNALPDDGHRLGLMIRPLDWIEYHYGGLQAVVQKEPYASALAKFPKVSEYLQAYRTKTKDGLFSVRNPIDLALTSVTVMMDANLLLQVKGALAKTDVSHLAPEILTICGGRLDPFDFLMAKEQHRDLYLSGQMCVHMHSDRVENDLAIKAGAQSGDNMFLGDEDLLKFLLYLIHMDPPASAP